MKRPGSPPKVDGRFCCDQLCSQGRDCPAIDKIRIDAAPPNGPSEATWRFFDVLLALLLVGVIGGLIFGGFNL